MLRNRTLSIAFFTILVDMMGFGIAFPILPILFNGQSNWFGDLSKIELGILYGILQASFAIAQFFGAPVLGALSDRFGRKPVMLMTLTGATIGYLLFAYGIANANLLLMFAGRIIPGFAGGNISIVYSSMADLSDDSQKVRDFGLAGAGFGLGMILGPVMGGILSQPGYLPFSGFQVPFLFMALLSVINLLVVLFFYKETIKQKSYAKIRPWSGIQNIYRALKPNKLQLVFLAVLFHASGFSLFLMFIHFFLIEQHGFQQSDIGYIFGYVGIWTVLTQAFLVRPLATRIKSSRLVPWVILGFAISVVFLLIPENAFWIYIILPIGTICQGLYLPNITAVVSDLSGEKEQGKMLGINQSLMAFSNAIPPIIGGWLLIMGAQMPVMLAVGFSLTGWVIFNIYLRKSK
ncbi:MAG: DHA1 family tetracycline resistance protein-like MFS transporter [Limisphaerales bacterium]|jgi:DHA1 family tetracycline resistance protein-like MFS transporter